MTMQYRKKGQIYQHMDNLLRFLLLEAIIINYCR